MSMHHDFMHIIAKWPQHYWLPKHIMSVLRLRYTEEEASMTNLYRHLQIKGQRGWLERHERGWLITPIGALQYPGGGGVNPKPSPLWFKEFPWLNEIHYHEEFNLDNYINRNIMYYLKDTRSAGMTFEQAMTNLKLAKKDYNLPPEQQGAFKET